MTQVLDTKVMETLLNSHLESVKDFVQSKTTALRKDISMIQVAMTEHTRMIKGLDVKVENLDKKIDGVRTELKEDNRSLREELKADNKSLRAELKADNKSLRAELKEEMHQMEGRLSAKIDGHAARLDDHEARISAVESAA